MKIPVLVFAAAAATAAAASSPSAAMPVAFAKRRTARGAAAVLPTAVARDVLNEALVADQTDQPSSSTVLGLRAGSAGVADSGLLQRLKIGFYFALWYALNVVYNSEYKHLLALPISSSFGDCPMAAPGLPSTLSVF